MVGKRSAGHLVRGLAAITALGIGVLACSGGASSAQESIRAKLEAGGMKVMSVELEPHETDQFIYAGERGDTFCLGMSGPANPEPGPGREFCTPRDGDVEIGFRCGKLDDVAACLDIGNRAFANRTGNPWQHFRAACDLENAEACEKLGIISRDGLSRHKVDPVEARKWFEKACTLGSATACAEVK